jgi:hypothetical protein
MVLFFFLVICSFLICFKSAIKNIKKVTSEFQLNVFNDNKWVRIDIKSLKVNKTTNFFKLKHKRANYYIDEKSDLKFESLIHLIEFVLFCFYINYNLKYLIYKYLDIINRLKQVLRLKMRLN